MERALSLKENIEAIKEELTAEEKFLESVIKTESFYKKNKKLVIGITVAVLVGVFGSMGYNYLKEQKELKSNELYLSLIQKADDAKKTELKSLNPKLYELYTMQVALKSGDVATLKSLQSSISDPILKDLLTYQIASLEEKGLLKYAKSGDPILKDFANLNAAYIELKNGNHQKAEDILGFISPTSTIYQIAQSLKHYLK
jgi:hypothetical protein